MALEVSKQLPGFNTIDYNFKEWSKYDWSGEGEEWTESEQWKTELADEVIKAYFEPGKIILEIGPGAGRWSGILAELSSQLILVDMTERSIEHCKGKLHSYPNCLFYKNNGADLSFLKDDSVDYLWSFDVFVHLAPNDTENYLKGLSRILKKNGLGIIHHPAAGGFKGGFRSSMTNELFCHLLAKYNFKVVHQQDSWGKDNSFSLQEFQDKITIFRKV